jgi:hypothetical protein
MRFRITQRVLAGADGLTWVVWDTQESKVVSRGSYISCANACREFNENVPETRLTQKQIDGDGNHRRRFWAMLSQVRSAVFPSTQSMVE